MDSIACGLIAGVVGDEIERRVNAYGIQSDFIKIENDTSRINVKMITPSEETAINGRGPKINPSHIEILYQKIEKIQDGDTLILAGSIPKGMSEDIYQQICEKIAPKEVKIIVDATGKLLLKTLPYHPFLIKPNQEELGEIVGATITTEEEVMLYAKKLQQKGARNVLVSRGSKGAILLDENQNVYKRKAISTSKRKNTVGAGDSMVAGFIAGYELYHDYEKALKLAMATAAATVNSIGLATKDEMSQFFN